MRRYALRGVVGAMLLLAGGGHLLQASTSSHSSAVAILNDASSGDNWGATGRTFGEQHFSPLTEINPQNVSRLGLAWSYDLPLDNSVSTPIAVDRILYTATAYSEVRAIDAPTGKLLCTYDPRVSETEAARVISDKQMSHSQITSEYEQALR